MLLVLYSTVGLLGGSRVYADGASWGRRPGDMDDGRGTKGVRTIRSWAMGRASGCGTGRVRI